MSRLSVVEIIEGGKCFLFSMTRLFVVILYNNQRLVSKNKLVKLAEKIVMHKLNYFLNAKIKTLVKRQVWTNITIVHPGAF